MNHFGRSNPHKPIYLFDFNGPIRNGGPFSSYITKEFEKIVIENGATQKDFEIASKNTNNGSYNYYLALCKNDIDLFNKYLPQALSNIDYRRVTREDNLIELLGRASENHEIYIYTDSCRLHVDYSFKRLFGGGIDKFNFIKVFDIVDTYKDGCFHKKEETGFDIFMEKVGATTDEITYFDFNSNNIEAAEERNIKCVYVSTPHDLVEYLKNEIPRCKCCNEFCKQPICQHCYRPLFKEDEKSVSKAFCDIDNFEPSPETEIIDLTFTNIIKIHWENMFNLKQLRLARCPKLETLEIVNSPKLESIDLHMCRHLRYINIIGPNKLIALDLTTTNVKYIPFPLPHCEYLSVAWTNISNLMDLPMVKYLDISGTSISNLEKLSQYTQLQNIHLCYLSELDEPVDMDQLLKLPNIASIDCNMIVDFNSSKYRTSVKNIFLQDGKASNFPKRFFSNSMINVALSNSNFGNMYKTPISSGDWTYAYRKLYGPYAPPPNDIKPIFEVKKVVDIPEGVDPKIAVNQICGSIFASALGDTLGAGGEHMSVENNRHLLDSSLDITWTHKKAWVNQGNHLMYRGGFTDDTALALTFMETMCKNDGVFDPVDNGQRIKKWINSGMAEHHDKVGAGGGSTTKIAVAMPGFDEDPIAATAEMKESFGNGGVMRMAPVGCYKFWDIDTVAKNASDFCRVTHNTNLSAFASTLIAVLVAKFIQMRCNMIEEVNIDETIEECRKYVSLKEEEYEIAKEFLMADNKRDLGLRKSKYTNIKTAAVALLALRKNWSITEAIENIVRWGGDCDTNAAVACAVLGAKWGFDSIPRDLLTYFYFGGIVMRDVKPFLGLMGLEFKDKAYDDQKIEFKE